MPINKIPEAAVTGREGSGCDVPVRVIEDNGTTARVQIEGCGIHLRQGQVHTVSSDRIERIR